MTKSFSITGSTIRSTASRIAALGVLALSGCTASAGREQIECLLHDQAAAWNRGDIHAFMDHYWKSDELTFSSAGRTVRGWQATLERYVRRYPDRSSMGVLEFSNLQIDIFGPNAALVLGKWHLTREAGDLGGNFSLVLHRTCGRWFIRHDHTSTLPDGAGSE